MTQIKRIWAAMLTVCMLLAIVPSAALAAETSGTCGENVNWSYNETIKALYISGTGDMQSFEWSFDVPWYYFRSEIISVTIKQGVTSVGKYAFSSLYKLIAVDASASSLTKIESNAFNECKALYTVKLPGTLNEIGSYAFFNCEAINTLTFPSALRTVGNFAFSGCKSLSAAVLPGSTETIGDNAFARCENLTEFTVPRGVKSFGDSVFLDCASMTKLRVQSGNEYYSTDDDDNLYNADKTVFLLRLPTKTDTSMTLPDTVETIAGGAFYGCTYLEDVIYSADNVKEIKRNAFSGSGLTEVTVYAGIEYGDGVFKNCKSLRHATLEEGVTWLVSSAFSGCTALEGVVIPESVTNIQPLAFSGCSALTSVNLSKNMKRVWDWTFRDCTALSSITIPDSIELIGKEAFKNCTALETVRIGSGVKSIASDSFLGCTSIRNIITDENNTAFSSDNGKVLYNKDKTELLLYPAGAPEESYTVLQSTQVISYNAFSGCAALTDAVLNEGLQTIRSDAFFNCTSLGAVSIPGSVTYISASAFRGTAYYNDAESWTDNCLYNGSWLLEVKADTVKNLSVAPGTEHLAEGFLYRPYLWGRAVIETVHLPASLAAVSDGLFRDCTNLASITVDEDSAFYTADSETGALYNKEKTKLVAYPPKRANTQLVLPDTVETIAPYAFYYSKNLTNVTLPGSLREIGDYAFYYCDKIQTLNLPDGLESIGDRAFDECRKFYPTVLPSTVKHAGECAFIYSGAYYDETNWDGNLFYIGDFLLDSRSDKDCTEITVKEGTVRIAHDAVGYNFPSAAEILLPAELEQAESGFLTWCEGLQSIRVDENNAYFTAVDGVLYDKNVTALLQYPRAKQETSFEIPETVTTLAPEALMYCRKLEHLTVPESVRTVSEYALGYCFGLERVTYMGTPEQWKKITVSEGNENFIGAEISYCAPYTESTAVRTENSVAVQTAAHNIEIGKAVYAAGYSGSKLIDVKKTIFADINEPLNFTLSGDIDTVTVYVWENGLTPYAKTPEVIPVP